MTELFSDTTELEEQIIIERIIDLDFRSCALRIDDMGAMASLLLALREAPQVGTN